MELSEMIGSNPAEGIFKTLFENSVIGMVITSPDGKILTNSAFRSMVGYTEKELLSLKWMNLTHPEDVANDNLVAQSLLTGEKESCRWQKRYIHKDGSIVYADISSVIHRDDQGNPLFFITTVNDVTEETRLKNFVAESEAQLSESQKIAFLGTYNFDLVSGFWTSSDILDEIFGIDKDYERSLESWSMIIHPDWRTDMVDYVNIYVVGKKQAFDKEYKIIRQSDGQERWVHGRGRLEFDASGNPSRLIGTIIDITTIKNAESAHRESEERYRLLIDLLPTLVFVKDVDGRFVAANEACARYLGLSSPAAIIGKTDEDFYSPEVAKAFRLDELQVMRGLPLINKEEASPDPPGNQRFFLTSKVPLYSVDGKCSGILGTSLDITEHKKAEIIQLIQINIAREVALVETLERMLATVRTELLRIMDATNFFVALYNPINDTLRKVLFIDQNDEFTEWEADSSLSGQVVKNKKTILLNRAGIEKFVADKNFDFLGTPAECWLGVPLFIDNHVIGVMVVQSYSNPLAYTKESASLLEMVAHELSLYIDRKKMIDDLVAAKDKAEESDRLKSAFLANMSHEIRTPLNSIIGFADLLVEDKNEMEDVLKYAGIIRSSGDRLLNLISNLIDISKIESGTERIVITKFSPAKVVREVITQFQYRPLKESILIKVNIPDSIKDKFIETDSMKFQQVLTNLVNNAFKFTEQGFIEIGIEDSPAGLLYFVRDSGIGIPKDRIDRVFDRFYQVDATIIRRFEGAGLGLSLCKGMIELLGGKIWVESQAGKGSKFTFTLPA